MQKKNISRTSPAWCASWLAAVLSLYISSTWAQPDDLAERYIEQWVAFYPSAAFGEGLASAAWRFEDYSSARLGDWIGFNRRVEQQLASISADAALDKRVDARVLLRQVRLELERWDHDGLLSRQPNWYARQVSDALTYVLISEKLTPAETYRAVTARLAGVRALCDLGVDNLVDGNPGLSNDAISTLEQTAGYYRDTLLDQSRQWVPETERETFADAVAQTTARMHALAQHIRANVLPSASVPGKFGRGVYARKLAIFSDNTLTPGNLPPMALEEIEQVRQLMLDVASRWWAETNAGQPAPVGQALIEAALEAMEEDRAGTQQELLQVFKTAISDSMDFLVRHDLATLPGNRDIIVDLLPEHSPMARVGGVFPPGPFDPQAKTLLYLPSIPDDAPLEARDGFYRSFNNHFNRMIISHEIFPGHDMQYKVALAKASKLRALFSNPYYAEGWASFSEVLMLEAGWGNGNHLTRLAHLRKRLENATRAYISVMVHTEGWQRDQVIEFAKTRGWLPAQFAINLWDRASDLYLSLQLTTYFVGSREFTALWETEQQRLGGQFNQRQFVDAVLATGSVPIDLLGELVRR